MENDPWVFSSDWEYATYANGLSSVDLLSAIDALTEGLQRWPNSLSINRSIAVYSAAAAIVCPELKQHYRNQAEQAWNIVLERDPDNVDALYGMATASYRKDDVASSIDYLLKAKDRIEISKDSLTSKRDIYVRLATLLDEIDRKDHAISLLSEYLKLHPDDNEAVLFYESMRRTSD